MEKKLFENNIDIFLTNIFTEETKEKVTIFPTSDDVNISEETAKISKIAKNIQNKEIVFGKEEVNINVLGGYFTYTDEDRKSIDEEILNLKEIIKSNTDENIKINIQIAFEELYTKYLEDKNKLKEELKKSTFDRLIVDIYSSINYINRQNGLSYSYEEIKNVFKYLKKIYGKDIIVSTYTSLIDSELKDDMENVENILKLKISKIILTPLVILKGSKISVKFVKGEITLPENIELQQILNKLAIIIDSKKTKYYINNDISIFKDAYVAGAIIPEINDNVVSEVWYVKVLEKIKKLNLKVKRIEIIVNSKNEEYIIGKDKINIKKFKELYDIYLDFVRYENIENIFKKFFVRKKT